MNEKTPVKKSRRWLIGALVLAAAAGALVAIYRPRVLPVEVATVRLGTFEQAIEEDGRLRIKTRYIVAAPTQAALLRPTLKVGDVVKAGDLLVTLEPAAPQMIDARTRSVLQQRIGSADAARRAAAAQVQRARTELARATLEAERASQLAQNNFISAAARDQATLARQATQQALSAAQAEQGVAEAEARAALARAEPTATGQASGRWHLTSPVDGQVLKLYQDSAVTVTTGQPLLEIGNTAAMEAVIDVLSGEVARIRPGAPVQLSPGGGAPAMAGQVTRVEPVAFTKVSALGIEEQRVNVVVDLPPSSAAQLGDGYRVDARITVLSQPDALLVPTAALVRDGAQWRVLVVTDGHARARPVLLHDRNAEVAWLKDGLREGEQVVVYPGSLVTDGQAVRVASQAKKIVLP